ncbi:MAG: acyltransferase family protein, partial [Muribaculaceae bacterium]|nr:acyltransferase family protein [Muribaculaceae bacterium]
MATAKSQRNYAVEYLRYAFMITIVIIHYIGHICYPDGPHPSSPTHFISYELDMGILSLCSIGVTGFMFISGFYGIHFKINRLVDLWLQCAFYLLILAIICSYWLLPVGRLTAFHNVINSIMPFTHGPWWFVSCYAIIYILSPILNYAIERIDQITFRNITIALALLLYVGMFTTAQLATQLILLLFIYISARYIRLYTPCWLEHNKVTIFIISASLLFGVAFIFAYLRLSRALEFFISSFNPLIYSTAVSLFFIIKDYTQVRCHPLIASMLSNVLAI